MSAVTDPTTRAIDRIRNPHRYRDTPWERRMKEQYPDVFFGWGYVDQWAATGQGWQLEQDAAGRIVVRAVGDVFASDAAALAWVRGWARRYGGAQGSIAGARCERALSLCRESRRQMRALPFAHVLEARTAA